MKNRLKKSVVVFFVLMKSVFGLTCPSTNDAPLCPDSGTTLLDETYPVQAYVISNMPQMGGIQSQKVTSEFISTIAKSYDYANMPQVFVPVTTDQEFLDVLSKVKTELANKKISPDKVANIISQITHVKSRKFTWQQDYFESFIDVKTGTPVIREFDFYLKERPQYISGAAEKIETAGQMCGLKKGQVIPTSHEKFNTQLKKEDRSFGGGEMGGNVEGAPGGFCLIGDNQSNKTAVEYCGKEENIIKLQTSWLAVGHVDEIFKILPAKFNDGRPAECQFSLMAASPRKALELMDGQNYSNQSFFSFRENLKDDELLEVKRSRSNKGASYGSQILCYYIDSALRDGSFSPQNNKNEKSNFDKSVFLNFIMSTSYAEAATKDLKSKFNCEDYIDQVPNENIKAGIEKDNITSNLNKAIQESIDKDKELIKSRILSRLPQCSKYYDVIDVPDLFYGSPPIEKNGKLILPKPSDVNSFLPNPTNAVLMNKTVLLPESGNKMFDNYVEKELEKRNLKMELIDTWDYAHVGNGNIHCSSHSIPFCKPRL